MIIIMMITILRRKGKLEAYLFFSKSLSKIYSVNSFPGSSGKEEEKITCPKGKSTCPGRPDGGFVEPWVNCMVIYLICGWNSCTETKRRKQLVTAKAMQVLYGKCFSENHHFLVIINI